MECFKSNKSKHYKRKRKQRKTNKDIEDKQIMIKGKREIMSKTEYKKEKQKEKRRIETKRKMKRTKKKRAENGDFEPLTEATQSIDIRRVITN